VTLLIAIGLAGYSQKRRGRGARISRVLSRNAHAAAEGTSPTGSNGRKALTGIRPELPRQRQQGIGRSSTMRVSLRRFQLAGVLAILSFASSVAMADAVSDAKAVVDEYSKPNAAWTGPTTGPKADAGKSIVYVSTDQRNGGALGAGEGVKEAAEKIGWKFTLIDGQGSVAGRTTALGQAVASKPDVIVLGGVDATEQATAIQDAAKQGIVIIGWHAYASPARMTRCDLHQTSPPIRWCAKAAASYPCALLNGKVGAIIFTDSTYEIALKKAHAMEDVIKALRRQQGAGIRRYPPGRCVERGLAAVTRGDVLRVVLAL